MPEIHTSKPENSISRFHRFRYRLGTHDAALPLALAAAICGLLTGLLINLFRYAIAVGADFFTTQFQAAGDSSAIALVSLTPEARFYLPLASAILLGFIYQALQPATRYTGLSHVVVRLHKFNGVMPLRNGILQFFAGAFALASGHSGGREGPAIHIGAAANSFLARKAHLPHNSIRTLIACGAAAAIGASFNTPVAGVIFAIEVIMMEYTLVSFIPIVVSAIIATSVTQLLLGNDSVFDIPELHAYSFWELPSMLLLGLVCGIAAVIFMRVQLATQRLQRLPVALRFGLAGLLTGSLAYYLPEVLGIGYTHVNSALAGSLHWQLLLGLCLAKILSSAFSNGTGMPVGIIGPSIVIGASVGGLIGYTVELLFPGLGSGTGFYALLGMGGVMAALLNAPLAALIAILEMTRTPEALLPGIIVIVIASLCTDQIFGQNSAVETVLRSQGIRLGEHPVAQALNRISLSAVADTNIEFLNREIYAGQLDLIANSTPRSIVIANQNRDYFLLSRKNFLLYYQSLQQAGATRPTYTDQMLEQLHDLNLPVGCLVSCALGATVTEARQLLNENDRCDGLLVIDSIGPLRGILRRETLNRLIDSW